MGFLGIIEESKRVYMVDFLSTEKGLVLSTIKLSSQLLTLSVSQSISQSVVMLVDKSLNHFRLYLIFLNGIDSY